MRNAAAAAAAAAVSKRVKRELQGTAVSTADYFKHTRAKSKKSKRKESR
jgi:hypothetical protein